MKPGLLGALAVTLAATLCCSTASAQENLPRAEEGGFCSGCVIVAAGVALVIGSIPLFALGEKALRRDDAVTLGLRIWDCDQTEAACSALQAAETNAVPYFVGGGILGGLGLATVATGAVLSWQVPSMRGASITLQPQLAGGSLLMRF